MSLPIGKIRIAMAILLPLLFLGGCATAPPAAKQDPSSPYTVRIPGADPMELESRTPPPNPQPELPPSDADEKKGRWLRVLEVERNPRQPAASPGEETPAAPSPPGN